MGMEKEDLPKELERIKDKEYAAKPLEQVSRADLLTELNALKKDEAAAKNPVTLLLAGIFPLTGGFHANLINLLESRSRKIEGIIIEELKKGGIMLSDDLIKNHDFLSRVISVFRAANMAESDEKVRRFARLLVAVTAGAIPTTEEYTYLMDIIKALSDREWVVLTILASYEIERKIVMRDFETCKIIQKEKCSCYDLIPEPPRYWKLFISEARDAIGVDEKVNNDREIYDVIARLKSSGCLGADEDTRTSEEGKLVLSATFYKLYNFIESSPAE